jgi:hypothetical protein
LTPAVSSYGKGLHRQPDNLVPCVDKNGAGFIVEQQSEELLAYADVWQLTKQSYECLRTVVIDEESTQASHILSCTETHTVLSCVGSMIVEPALRENYPTRVAMTFDSLCSALPSVFKKHSPFPVHVLGVGSFAFGLIKNLADPIGDANFAMDRAPSKQVKTEPTQYRQRK